MKRNHRFLTTLKPVFFITLFLVSVAMTTAENTTTNERPNGPVDLYNAAGFPCVAAHSTTRALSSTYNGPLYQVVRKSDGKTLDIGIVPPNGNDPGGYADAAAQDEFCEGTICRISRIYDQSGKGNDLLQAPPGTFVGPAVGGFNELPIADMAPITIMGHKAYGTYIMPGMGLRNNNATGLPINDEAEGIYMVFDGKHFDSGCCFNYGNTSTNSDAVGRGTMSTVYYGTSTAWGRGEGTGPWIMSDMEAGLFSGYNTKENKENPTIDSWRFVTGMVNGGGGNQWEIRGGDAQQGELTTFYKGIRPESRENDNYYPMHRKGSIQMGNGGDNGNGSAGTFYEGVMTFGYPSDEVIAAVQQNIIAAGYDVSKVTTSRLRTFSPGATQDVSVGFTNTTGQSVKDVSIKVVLPKGWKSTAKNDNKSTTVAPGESVSQVFTITSPAKADAGFLTGKVECKALATGESFIEIASQRIRSAAPVKINEVRFNTSDNSTNQFVELYNASDSEVDLSNWSIINTRSEWAPLTLGTIPSGIRLAPENYYLLALSGSGLATSAPKGANIIHVSSTEGYAVGQHISIGKVEYVINNVGTPASEMTTIFVPVSTGPWLNIPIGATNIPVTSAVGFVVGEKMGIDLGGNYEEVEVTAVGKASTQTQLAEAAKAGDTSIKVWHTSNMTEGDVLTINTGARVEKVTVAKILDVVEKPVRGRAPQAGEVQLTAPLQKDHMLEVVVSSPGTGISFKPATQFPHKSGESVQALGSGLRLTYTLAKDYEFGTPIMNPQATGGYQDTVDPDQWYGFPLSVHAGSIALLDASGEVVVDAMVYGSQQSNSSANGTIASPEIAVLEGDQHQGGCIAVIPGATARYFRLPNPNQANYSLGRYPDGADADSNCSDYMVQNSVHLVLPAEAGTDNIKVSSTDGFVAGQRIYIDMGNNIEITKIKEVGTSGGTKTTAAAAIGATSIAVEGTEGFAEGQTILLGPAGQQKTAVVASISRSRRFFRTSDVSDSIRVQKPLTFEIAAGTQVAGSGITLESPLVKPHDIKTQVADNEPTPGGPNHYVKQ